MVNKNVIVYGLPGSGKTTVGKILSEKLGRFFIDTDKLIEETHRTEISNLFEKFGEEHFRNLESEAIERISKMQNLVISVGGGALTRKENIDFLKKNGIFVFLNSRIDVLFSRISEDDSRPLLKGKSIQEKRKKLEKIYNERYELYKNLADIAINSDQNLETVIAEILSNLESLGIRRQKEFFEEKIIDVATDSRHYSIKVGYDILEDTILGCLKDFEPSKVVIVTNPILYHIAGKKLEESIASMEFLVGSILIDDNEILKAPRTLFKIIDGMIRQELDRDSLVISIGGGVIGDITGLACALYMRGISWFYVPTTLLSQVDSSIGGKVAVNYAKKKNFLGTFHQPSYVITDTRFLKVLPEEIYLEGLAEVVKATVIEGFEIFDYNVENSEKIIDRYSYILNELIYQSIKIKGKIVEQDEYDKGLRMLLNFGHTFGHAIESYLNYKISHSKAVAVGMVLETELAIWLGLTSVSTKEKIIKILKKFGLPTSLKEIGIYNTSKLVEFLKSDKKVYQGKYRFALPYDIGDVRITVITKEQLKEFSKELEEEVLI